MKKLTAYILSIICVFIFAGCAGNTGTSADSNRAGGAVSVHIWDDVTEVKITHVLMGQLTEWSIEGDDIEALRIWTNGLKYELREFEEGNTPGDGDGQEAYWFELTGGDYPGFDYIICGPDDCYLIIESDWYVVNNPSDPPVEAP